MTIRARTRMSMAPFLVGVALTLATACSFANGSDKGGNASAETASHDEVVNNAQKLIEDGRETFRFDTFGNEAFWGDKLKLHQAIAGAANGGVGPGVSPKMALETLGLKVDVDALPAPLVGRLKAGRVDLNDPAVTLALIKLDAVVGVKGFFHENGMIRSIGITCAICHSTVDDSFSAGIGRRRDGWAAQDLDVGAIIASAPDLRPIVDLLRNAPALSTLDEATLRGVLTGWGAGRFDAEVLHDGKALGPDGKSHPTLIPPAFRLAGVNLHTWTGFGSVPYWNAYVANTQMQGIGTFFDPRLNDPEKFPIAAATGRWNMRPPAGRSDRVTSKLPALHFYQLAIPVPKPKEGIDFNKEAAERGDALFSGKAGCARCHVEPLWTEPGHNLHTAEEIGVDDFQAKRSPEEKYRTAPLNALFTHMKRGFYHDGRFAALLDVINHYNDHFNLGLTDQEKEDLIEYLKSI